MENNKNATTRNMSDRRNTYYSYLGILIILLTVPLSIKTAFNENSIIDGISNSAYVFALGGFFSYVLIDEKSTNPLLIFFSKWIRLIGLFIALPVIILSIVYSLILYFIYEIDWMHILSYPIGLAIILWPAIKFGLVAIVIYWVIKFLIEYFAERVAHHLKN